MHNKVVNYGLAFLNNWSEHFHGEFLFLSGDVIERNKVPETGQMYMLDALWLVVGLWWLVKNQNKGTRLIFWWLIVAPIAAALTFQSPHALRAQNMVIPLVIISACGIVKLFNWFKSRGVNTLSHQGWIQIHTPGYILTIFIVLSIFLNFTRYLHMYWIHMAKKYPFSSQYGVKELVSYVNENGSKYEKIIVTDRYDQPYILFLFYGVATDPLKYSPDKFQNSHELTGRDKFGFSTVREFAKFEFRSIKWDMDQPGNPNSLIIGTNEEIPDEANIVKEIYGSNGYKYFEVVAN